VAIDDPAAPPLALEESLTTLPEWFFVWARYSHPLEQANWSARLMISLIPVSRFRITYEVAGPDDRFSHWNE